MNAPFPKPYPQADAGHCALAGQANKWRGECIEYFAELEQIVENLLRVLSQVPKHGGKITTGQPVGAAFKHLREITGAKGPFAAKGKAISATLAELALWFEWRAHLTHGVMTVWRGRTTNGCLPSPIALPTRIPSEPMRSRGRTRVS